MSTFYIQIFAHSLESSLLADCLFVGPRPPLSFQCCSLHTPSESHFDCVLRKAWVSSPASQLALHAEGVASILLWENPLLNSPTSKNHHCSARFSQPLLRAKFPAIAGLIWPDSFLQSEALSHWTINYFARLCQVHITYMAGRFVSRIAKICAYILKVKKFAESAFQSQNICGKSM